MRMFGALRLPAFVKSPDTNLELFLLLLEIPLVCDNKFLVSGSVLGIWLIVGEEGPDKWPKYSANEHPGQNDPSGSHIEGRGAVRHHLRNIHFPPLMLGRGLQLVDAGRDFLDRIGLE
jgi:hypothetical protein